MFNIKKSFLNYITFWVQACSLIEIFRVFQGPSLYQCQRLLSVSIVPRISGLHIRITQHFMFLSSCLVDVLNHGDRIPFKYKVKLATVVEGHPKAAFLVATTPRGRGGRYSFPGIAPLYPWYVSYIAEC